MSTTQLSRLDRLMLRIAPQTALGRIRARQVANTLMRHYEAAQAGRRTSGWPRKSTDANQANLPALSVLRDHARDLNRNNPWARRGKQVIGNNVVGWGIVPKPIDAGDRALNKARKLWKAWAGSTQCDHAGHRNLYGLQRLVLDTVVESGEALVRRFRVAPSNDVAIPLQLQVLEPDYIDTTTHGQTTIDGGRIVQGIEFDNHRRVAYWLFPEHPGSTFLPGSRIMPISQRVPAAEVMHVYGRSAPGQARGVTWFAPVIVEARISTNTKTRSCSGKRSRRCFAVFVTDVDGSSLPVGEQSADNPLIEELQPGLILRLPAGKSIEFATPPTVTESNFDERQLRAIAAGLGVTYEDLTGDYSQVNFSSARMSRLEHWANVHSGNGNMLIPMFCGAAIPKRTGASTQSS
jgi:lambda family phage portal protein